MRAKRIMRLENLEEREVLTTVPGLELDQFAHTRPSDRPVADQVMNEIAGSVPDLVVEEEFMLNFSDGTQVGSEGFKAKPPQIPNQLVDQVIDGDFNDDGTAPLVDQVMNEIAGSVPDLVVEEEFMLNFSDGTQVGSEGFKAKPPQIPNQLVDQVIDGNFNDDGVTDLGDRTYAGATRAAPPLDPTTSGGYHAGW